MNEYINKQKLIKAIEDKRPLNWNDTEAELAEQRAFDYIIDLIKDFNEDPCIVTFEGGEGYTDEQGGKGGRRMNIDKAIEHAFEVSTTCENASCALEHVQLAFWLKQLKELQSILGYSYDLDRLKELADADKEGRCLILPCKVGDVLYKPTRTFVSSFKVAFIEVSMCNCLFIHTNLISGINMTGEIFKEDDIGKSVFLTEEEAEKALEELK